MKYCSQCGCINCTCSHASFADPAPKPRTNEYHFESIGSDRFKFTIFNDENNRRPMCLTMHSTRSSNFLRSVLQTNGYKEM